MSVVKKGLGLFLVVVSLASAKVWGQGASSPFVTYGFGDSYGNALIHNQGMAGVGVSQPQYWFLNNQNPALLVYNTLTVFEAGVVVEQRKLSSSNGINSKSRGGNMNYLATAFPIKPGQWTTSIGLMPYTNVDYAFQYEEVDVNENTIVFREEGSGGLTQLYWSNGVRVHKNFSVGLKATYIFGSKDDLYSTWLTTNPYSTVVQEKTVASDFNFSTGVSYSIDSIGRKNLRFSAGGVIQFGSDLSSKFNRKFYTITQGGDTLFSDDLGRSRGVTKLPGNYTFGISLSRGTKWSIGTEVSVQDWSGFESINADDEENLTNAWRLALGGEFTPDPTGLGGYLKRVTYRTGLSYEKNPFLVNGNQVKDFGINFGLSLPAGRSSLDVAFKVGKRGNKADNILEENYFKVYFGVTFNDQWFIKRKFD